MKLSREQVIELADDIPSNTSDNDSFKAISERRYGRRDVLRSALLAGTALAIGGAATLSRPTQAEGSSFNFTEISHDVDETHHVAPEYDADILLRWGDPLFDDSPTFDPMNQSAEAQVKQFGYNNDFIGILPLEDDRALLCVNHEYTNEELMFPGLGRQGKADFAGMTEELVRIEMAAHGGTVVEIVRGSNGKWQVDTSGERNRRITADTPMRISGPAAGHGRMITEADPTGTDVRGTINNCAGGMTPWGT